MTVDGRGVPATRPALTEALGDLLSTADVGDENTPRVLMIDAFERLVPLEHGIRTELLPGLPAGTVTVIASRVPPSPEWRADNAWMDLLRVVSLRNLAPADSGDYLRRMGVVGEVADQVVRTTHGHPFALALLADIVVRGGSVSVEPLPPDLLRALVDRFLDVVPTKSHRQALGVCSIARITTQSMLRDVMTTSDDPDEGEVAAVFEWLRELSFVQADPDGLHPDDLAREVLDAELRWRDPQGYRDVLRRVWRHVRSQVRSAGVREQRHAIHDLKFLFRNLAGVRSPVDWSSWSQVQPEPEPALPSDRESILRLIRAAEGVESGRIAALWLERQPGGFHVLRRADGSVRGVVGLLDLAQATAEDLVADPGARSAWEHATSRQAPRPGEAVIALRLLVDADAYQDPSPTLNAAPVLQMQQFLRCSNLSWGFLAMFEPDRWNEYFAVADLHRVTGADFAVGGRTYGLFAHDFRTVPVDAWIDMVVERGLSGDADPADLVGAERLLVLSKVEFEQAVRQALQHITRPKVLGRNPLVRTRLVQGRVGEGVSGGQVLEALVRDAVNTLRANPKDDRLLRALDRTYLRPASTQEAAASMLGVPFSSYRRHLSQAIARITEVLWKQELYGEGAPGEVPR